MHQAEGAAPDGPEDACAASQLVASRQGQREEGNAHRDPGHGSGQPGQPREGGRATRDRRPAPSFRAGGCSAGNACPSWVAERVASGLADEDACGAHPRHVEATPRWSEEWAQAPTRRPAPPPELRQGRSPSVTAARCRGRTGSRHRRRGVGCRLSIGAASPGRRGGDIETFKGDS